MTDRQAAIDKVDEASQFVIDHMAFGDEEIKTTQAALTLAKELLEPLEIQSMAEWNKRVNGAVEKFVEEVGE